MYIDGMDGFRGRSVILQECIMFVRMYTIQSHIEKQKRAEYPSTLNSIEFDMWRYQYTG